MRLPILDRGHTPIKKVLYWMLRKYCDPIPGPILIMSYRRALFGKDFAQCLQEAMRSSRHFTLAETELMSAFVSDQNRCTY